MLGLVILAIIYYGITQPPISLDEGHPYDAQVYYNMASQVAAGEPVSELRPFTYRVGSPWLVGTFFPEDLNAGFRLINLLFGFLTLPLLFLYLRRHLVADATVLLLLLFLYVTNPNAPFRFAHYIAAYSDPPALFFVLSLLVLADRVRELDWKWSLAVTAIGVAGTLFREITLCGVLVFVYAQCFRLRAGLPFVELLSRRKLVLCLPPLLASIATVVVLHAGIEGAGAYRYGTQMQGVIVQLLQQPSIYLLAWLTAFGCIPIVLLLGMNRDLGRFLAERQSVAVFLFGSLLLSLTAGFHTDRILFWSYPAILLLFGHFLQSHPVMRAGLGGKLLFFFPVALVQVLAYRMWLPIPDDPDAGLFSPGLPERVLFAPFGDSSLGHTYASAMLPETRLLMLSQFALLAIYLGSVLFLTRHRQTNTPASPD